MYIDVPFNSTDLVVLLIIGVMFVLGIKTVIGFFKKPAVPVSPDVMKEDMKPDSICEAGKAITVSIDGMMCGMCESHVKDAIRKAFPDARGLTASHETGKARFTLERTVSVREIMTELDETVASQGYRILGVKTQ